MAGAFVLIVAAKPAPSRRSAAGSWYSGRRIRSLSVMTTGRSSWLLNGQILKRGRPELNRRLLAPAMHTYPCHQVIVIVPQVRRCASEQREARSSRGERGRFPPCPSPHSCCWLAAPLAAVEISSHLESAKPCSAGMFALWAAVLRASHRPVRCALIIGLCAPQDVISGRAWLWATLAWPFFRQVV